MSPGARWIGIIVGLLVGNAVAVAVLIGAAGSTRGRVLPDYYQRAIGWDQTMAEAEASVRLGWTGAVAARGRVIELTVRDPAGAPVAGAAVTVHGVPRGHTDRPTSATLVAAGPGVYRATLPGDRAGLHDLAILVERGPDRWVADRLVELAGTGRP